MASALVKVILRPIPLWQAALLLAIAFGYLSWQQQQSNLLIAEPLKEMVYLTDTIFLPATVPVLPESKPVAPKKRVVVNTKDSPKPNKESTQAQVAEAREKPTKIAIPAEEVSRTVDKDAHLMDIIVTTFQ